MIKSNLVVPKLGPFTGVPAVNSSGEPKNTGWEKPGYFAKKTERNVIPPGTFTVPIGLCGSRVSPDIGYNGINTSVLGPSREFDWKYGYFGPQAKVPYGQPRTWNTYVRVQRKVQLGTGMGVWKGSSSSFQAIGGDGGVLTAFHPGIPGTVYSGGRAYGSVDLGVLDTYGSVTKSFIMEYEHELMLKALDKTKVADLGEVLVEIVELITIWKKLALSGETLIRGLLQYDLTDRKGLLGFLEGCSSLWLGWSFGLKPTWDTIADLVNNRERLVREYSGFTVEASLLDKPLYTWRRTAHVPTYTGDITQYGPPNYQRCYTTASSSGGGSSWWVTSKDGDSDSSVDGSGAVSHEVTGSVKVDLNCSMELFVRPDFVLQQLGLTNVAALAWEAVPFSFLVDWLIKVGRTLESLRVVGGVISRVNFDHVYKFQSTTSFGSYAATTVETRFNRGLTYVPDYLTGQYGVVSVYSNNPWSSTDEIEQFDRRLELGSGIKEWNTRAANGLALYVLLAGKLIDARARSGFLLRQAEMLKYMKLWK